MSKVSVLGIKIDRCDFNQSIQTIDNFVKSKKPHNIVTINPEFIMTARADKEFKEALNNADLAVCDGVGIIWASKILGKPLTERVAGVDLVYRIAKLASQRHYSVYFLGAGEGIAQKAVSILKKKYPKLKIAGIESGSPHDLSIIDRIVKTKPDILLVAFGHPKQEKWLYKFKQSLGVPVMIGVGGTFDFISGKIPRAPKWVRTIGFEWFYRLIKQPWRLKRQLKLLQFAWLVITKRWRHKHHPTHFSSL